MIEKIISEKLYGERLEINPSNNEDICKLDYNLIVKLTAIYTENYANDALRRSSRMEQKEVCNERIEKYSKGNLISF